MHINNLINNIPCTSLNFESKLWNWSFSVDLSNFHLFNDKFVFILSICKLCYYLIFSWVRIWAWSHPMCTELQKQECFLFNYFLHLFFNRTILYCRFAQHMWRSTLHVGKETSIILENYMGRVCSHYIVGKY